MKRLFALEPVLLANIAKALLVVAVAFGMPLTGAQTAALVGIVVPAIALIGAATRQVVSPVVKVAEVLGKPVGVVNQVLKEVTG